MIEDEKKMDDGKNIENRSFLLEQKEGIKLIRNASGVYQWEIKTNSLDVNNIIEIDISIRKRLDELNLNYNKKVKE